ncbi:hypothetical protein VNO77_24187 [Canavalia gladiata]|uniref:Uncharacterized protein n=1 Tax=Canavalia gladiata TaxID=3824 RepID=A0AAN9QFZ9_CANGL
MYCWENIRRGAMEFTQVLCAPHFGARDIGDSFIIDPVHRQAVTTTTTVHRHSGFLSLTDSGHIISTGTIAPS